MKKGFYISKTVGAVGLLLGASAVITIIALSVAYSKEKSKNVTDTTTPKPSLEPWDKYRLPDTLRPYKYDVTLWPRLTKNEHGMYVFTGNSTVDFECVKETDLILLHSNKLNLTKISGHLATLTGLDGAATPTIKSTWLQETTQYLVIQLNSKLVPGKSYQLYTDFIGELAKDLYGFYRSEYYEGSELKVIATTQMEPTSARKAFPCFDEPGLKAVFHVTLIHDRNTIALSNGIETGIINATVDGIEVSVTSFKPTPIMATYLLAFVVSEYDFIRTPEGAKVMIRVWARRQAIAKGQGDYALEKVGPILEFMEKHYNATYPLEKSDQVAITDFGAGAMENWGLITYQESLLMYDPKQSISEKASMVVTIAHEIAHMWFGNLVTMKWWNNLWLNEAFASYVSYLGTEIAEPNGNMNDNIISDIRGALKRDAFPSSHPLSFPEEEINTPNEIHRVFDTITYSKGALVLRMLSEFLTEAVFSRGLSNYLNEFAYNNTVNADLWKHLQAEVDRTPTLQLPDTIEKIMNPWILQMGFPVITINTTTGTISQKHFLIKPQSVVKRSSIYNYEWVVPITWSKNGTIQDRKWLFSKSDVRDSMKTTEWILANLNVAGFYRVNYDKGNWERLIAQLNSDHKVIPVLNRAQIMDDACTLSRANIIDPLLALKTTQYLSKETESSPWELYSDHILYYFDMYQHTKMYGSLQKYVKKQVEPVFIHMKNITEDFTNLHYGDRFKYAVFSLACKVGVDSCTGLSVDWFRKWMNNPEENMIHHFKFRVYCEAVAAGGVKEWDFVWERFKNSTNTTTDESWELRNALTCTRDPYLLSRCLQYFLDPTMDHSQNYNITVLKRIKDIAQYDNLKLLLWNYIRHNWRSILNNDDASHDLPGVITKVTSGFSTESDLKQLLDFKVEQATTISKDVAKALDQSIAKTKDKMKWTEKDQEMFQWLTSAAAEL